MPLSPGSRLGNYEILAPLGKGGMGEVFRARDTKLGREVAVKVLPAAFAANQDRLARFEREAKVLASLNHPNIATIYAIEESPEGKALVMELIPGAPIQGPVPLETALGYARQIASALDAAHEKGITHRDLKPANIMLTPDGGIKVLDFGLAAVTQPTSETDPTATAITLTMSPTRVGMILGTAPYMSPEQARGQSVDRRTDIWAFGVVLWELLTGKRLFEGSDVTETLAFVVTKEPDYARTSPTVRRLLTSCLEKDPKKRLRDIGDWERLLDQPAAATRDKRSSAYAPWIVAAAACVALASLAFVHFTARPAPTPTVQFTMEAPKGQNFSGQIPRFAISPDGSAVAAATGTTVSGAQIGGIAVRRFDEADTRLVVAGIDSAGGVMPFWSHDSKTIGFFADGKLKRVSAQGGPIRVLCDAFNNDASATWNRDDVILFSGSATGPDRLSSGVWKVSANGGTPERVIATEADHPLRWLQFLPDGKHFLYLDTVASSAGDAPGVVEGNVYVASIDGGSTRKLIMKSSFAVRYSEGYLLFAQDGALMAQRFNLSAYALEGPPALVASTVGGLGNGRLGTSVSDNGNLAIVDSLNNIDGRRLVWHDRAGREVSEVAGSGVHLQLSPSGNSRSRPARRGEAARSFSSICCVRSPPASRRKRCGPCGLPTRNGWPTSARVAFTEDGPPGSASPNCYSRLASRCD